MFSKVYLILLGFVATVGLVAARPAQDSDPAKGIYNYDLHKLKTVKTTPTNDLAKETTMAFHGKPHAGVDIQCGYCSGCFASSQKTGNDYKAPGSCLKSILDIYESQDKWVNTTALVYTRGENYNISGTFKLPDAAYGGMPNKGFQLSTYDCANGASAAIRCDQCEGSPCTNGGNSGPHLPPDSGVN